MVGNQRKGWLQNGAMKQHPLCRAARALHLAVACIAQVAPVYSHAPGHAGDPANELTDALAGAPIGDQELWGQDHGLALIGSHTLRYVMYNPIVCLHGMMAV